MIRSLYNLTVTDVPVGAVVASSSSDAIAEFVQRENIALRALGLPELSLEEHEALEMRVEAHWVRDLP